MVGKETTFVEVKGMDGQMKAMMITKEFIPREHAPFSQDWIVLSLLILFGLLGIIRIFYPREFKYLVECIRTPGMIRQVMRDENPFSHLGNWGFLFITFASLGLFLYQHDLQYGWDLLPFEGWRLFLLYAGILFGLFILKVLSMAFVKWLLGEDPGVMEYLYHQLIFYKILGIVFYPLVLINFFLAGFPDEWGFYLGYFFLLFIFLFRILRGVNIGTEYKVSKFYMFLYLCTLELLPLVVIVKAFINNY